MLPAGSVTPRLHLVPSVHGRKRVIGTGDMTLNGDTEWWHLMVTLSGDTTLGGSLTGSVWTLVGHHTTSDVT